MDRRVGTRLLAAGLVVAVLAAAWLLWPAPAVACAPRADDPQQYLLRICQHIQATGIDVAPARADSYTIKRVEQRTDGDRAVVWVFLSCCYLGDIAIFDRATGELLDFRVGAK
jgi:hypothetical protein